MNYKRRLPVFNLRYIQRLPKIVVHIHTHIKLQLRNIDVVRNMMLHFDQQIIIGAEVLDDLLLFFDRGEGRKCESLGLSRFVLGYFGHRSIVYLLFLVEGWNF